MTAPLFSAQVEAIAEIGAIGKALGIADICVRASPESLSITAVDPAGVCLVSATLPITGGPATWEAWFPVEKVADAAKALSGLGSVDALWDAPRLKLKSGRRHRTISAVVARDGSSPRIPPIPFAIACPVPTAFFRDLVKRSSGIDTSHATFVASSGELRITVADDVGEYSDATPIESPLSADGQYDLTLVGKMVALASSIEMRYSFGPSMPCQFDFALDAGGTATVLLAPLVTVQ